LEVLRDTNLQASIELDPEYGLFNTPHNRVSSKEQKVAHIWSQVEPMVLETISPDLEA
jgi:hypothetical protein